MGNAAGRWDNSSGEIHMLGVQVRLNGYEVLWLGKFSVSKSGRKESD